MTEITVRNDYHIIDPVAFFIALFGGPILFTLATFWLLLIPVAALFFGGPIYLALGTPILLIHLRRHPAQSDVLALLAVKTLLVLLLPIVLFGMITANIDAVGLGMAIVLMGLIFGPCWAACFGWIYCKLARDFYTNPMPA